MSNQTEPPQHAKQADTTSLQGCRGQPGDLSLSTVSHSPFFHVSLCLSTRRLMVTRCVAPQHCSSSKEQRYYARPARLTTTTLNPEPAVPQTCRTNPRHTARRSTTFISAAIAPVIASTIECWRGVDRQPIHRARAVWRKVSHPSEATPTMRHSRSHRMMTSAAQNEPLARRLLKVAPRCSEPAAAALPSSRFSQSCLHGSQKVASAVSSGQHGCGGGSGSTGSGRRTRHRPASWHRRRSHQWTRTAHHHRTGARGIAPARQCRPSQVRRCTCLGRRTHLGCGR